MPFQKKKIFNKNKIILKTVVCCRYSLAWSKKSQRYHLSEVIVSNNCVGRGEVTSLLGGTHVEGIVFKHHYYNEKQKKWV